MAIGHRVLSILLYSIAALVSLFSSFFGLMACAWGGLLGGPDHPITLSGTLFWVLPCLSLPSIVLFIWRPRAGLICAWAIVIGMFCNLAVTNVQTCMKGECTTSNPIVVAFGSVLGFGPGGLIFLLSPLCLQLTRKLR
jgi:hypothetical protein